MTYVDDEITRLKRSRALLKTKLKREKKALAEYRRKHIDMATRVQRDEEKIKDLDREIELLEHKHQSVPHEVPPWARNTN